MWFFPGFGIRPGRKVTWSKVLQVLRTRGSSTCEYYSYCTQNIIYSIDYYYFTVVHTNSTKVLSLFYHRSGIICVALVAKPRVAA